MERGTPTDRDLTLAESMVNSALTPEIGGLIQRIDTDNPKWPLGKKRQILALITAGTLGDDQFTADLLGIKVADVGIHLKNIADKLTDEDLAKVAELTPANDSQPPDHPTPAPENEEKLPPTASFSTILKADALYQATWPNIQIGLEPKNQPVYEQELSRLQKLDRKYGFGLSPSHLAAHAALRTADIVSQPPPPTKHRNKPKKPLDPETVFVQLPDGSTRKVSKQVLDIIRQAARLKEEEGLNYKQIGGRLGRSTTSIRDYFAILAAGADTILGRD